MSKLENFKSAELNNAEKVEGQFFLWGWLFRRRSYSYGYNSYNRGGCGCNYGCGYH